MSGGVLWQVVTLENGRQRHHARYGAWLLSVLDWGDGFFSWYVYDEAIGDDVARGESKSADEAKLAIERAAGCLIEREGSIAARL